jgi:hypothetical protein
VGGQPPEVFINPMGLSMPYGMSRLHFCLEPDMTSNAVVRNFIPKRAARTLAEQLEPLLGSESPIRGLEVQEHFASAKEPAFMDTVPAADLPKPAKVCAANWSYGDIAPTTVLYSGATAPHKGSEPPAIQLDPTASPDLWAELESQLHDYAVAFTVKEFLDNNPEQMQEHHGLYLKACIAIKRSQIEFAKTQPGPAKSADFKATSTPSSPLLLGIWEWLKKESSSPYWIGASLLGLYWIGRSLGLQ